MQKVHARAADQTAAEQAQNNRCKASTETQPRVVDPNEAPMQGNKRDLALRRTKALLVYK